LALIVASVVIAIRNWQEDPSQRTGSHLGTWFVRVLVGGMWFQGMLWKLPLPVSGGLQYWTEQMASRVAFEVHRELVTDYLPYLYILNPIIFLAEFTFAVSLILGLGVRLIGVLAIIFVLHLWLGIYRPGTPAEWPWCYIFLAIIMFLFALHAAGAASVSMPGCAATWWRCGMERAFSVRCSIWPGERSRRCPISRARPST
jgi:uncharacterized membrane protein YphA (DoxX/SURF4 family)